MLKKKIDVMLEWFYSYSYKFLMVLLVILKIIYKYLLYMLYVSKNYILCILMESEYNFIIL